MVHIYMYLHIYIYIYSSIYTETISVVFKIPIYPPTHSTEETPPSFTKLAITDPTDLNDRIEACHSSLLGAIPG